MQNPRLRMPGRNEPAANKKPASVRCRFSMARVSAQIARGCGQAVSSRLRNIQAVFSCTSRRWVSRSAVG